MESDLNFDYFEFAPEPLIIADFDKKAVKFNQKIKILFDTKISIGVDLGEINFLNPNSENIFISPLFDTYFDFDFENREITYEKNKDFTATFLLSSKKIILDDKPYLYLSFKNISDMVSFKKIFEELYDSLSFKTIELDHVISEKEKAYKLLKQKDDEMLRQLFLAREVQEGIFPEINETIKGYEIASLSKAASIVSGDLLTILDSDEQYLDFVIADVTGHGVPSALITMMLKMSFQMRIEEVRDPGLIVEAVNNDMNKILSSATIFVTLMFARLEYSTGLVHIMDCGHTPPIIIRKDKTVERPDINGMMLGVIEEIDYGKATLQINPGDMIIFLTDGIIEAQDSNSVFYEDQFVEHLSKINEKPSSVVIDEALKAVYSFTDKEELNDDATIFCIKRL